MSAAAESPPLDGSGPGTDPELALDVSEVAKRFKTGNREVDALRGVSFGVRSGLVAGLVGPDGAGKSTLMRLAAGLLVPDAGRITVLGLDSVRDALQVQAAIGYMPQRFGLYEDLSVQENLDLYADLQGVPKGARTERHRELMKMTGLADFTARLAGRLSGGMKQKLGLACTMLRAPRLLLLDEPTVGVDPVSRRELWAIVYELVKSERMSVLLSTAYLDEAERCSEVVLLSAGRVLEQGPPQSMTASMLGRTYVAAAPDMNRRRIQELLADAPGVIDSVIQGDGIRLVMADATAPRAEVLLADVPGAVISPVDARFEDCFVSLLHREPETAPRKSARPRPASPVRDRPTAEQPAIEVRNAARRFGDFYAVRDLSFEVPRGQVFGLLGANGAGKTTTFRMLCGLLPASAGDLRVAGVDLRRAPAAARAKIGYMSQRFSLYGNLSVGQNLAFYSSTYGLSGARRASRVAWAIEEFQLSTVSAVGASELTLGYQQRLALACALMHEPEILFLDEPTSGVDPLARREFWRRITALAEDGVTVLVTTHFMQEAEYCDRLAILSAGRMLALGDPHAIRANASSPGRPQATLEDAFIQLIEGSARSTSQ